MKCIRYFKLILPFETLYLQLLMIWLHNLAWLHVFFLYRVQWIINTLNFCSIPVSILSIITFEYLFREYRAIMRWPHSSQVAIHCLWVILYICMYSLHQARTPVSDIVKARVIEWVHQAQVLQYRPLIFHWLLIAFSSSHVRLYS